MLYEASLTGDQIVKLIEQLPALILSVVSLIAALRAGKKAQDAQQSAVTAQEKAAEAAREQIHFALREAVRRAPQAFVAPASPADAGAEKEKPHA
ncbi:MAG: hypothetical protein OHK0029_20620 [Armatimonadaceae bacterium]